MPHEGVNGLCQNSGLHRGFDRHGDRCVLALVFRLYCATRNAKGVDDVLYIEFPFPRDLGKRVKVREVQADATLIFRPT